MRAQWHEILVVSHERAIFVPELDGELDFGEIWTGSGALHDALAALACNAIASPATPR